MLSLADQLHENVDFIPPGLCTPPTLLNISTWGSITMTKLEIHLKFAGQIEHLFSFAYLQALQEGSLYWSSIT